MGVGARPWRTEEPRWTILSLLRHFIAGHLRCPVCDTRLVSVSIGLRRALLWAVVVEEFLLVILIMRLA
jgi:hypothetical protein